MTEKCAVCGKTEFEHQYHPSNIKHSIFKWSGLKSALLARRLKERFPCKKYGGFCTESNRCYALKNVRGGDFGWGECIHNKETKR